MAQVVAMRAIQSSILCPGAGSAQGRTSNKLKPPSFASRVLASEEKKCSRKVFGSSKRRFEIAAKRPLQTEVVPVSPEDLPKVRATQFLVFGLFGEGN